MATIPPAVFQSIGFDAWLDPDLLRFIRRAARWLACHLKQSHLGGEDIEQEILLDLWRKRNQYDATRSQTKTFLRRLVRNKLVEIVRYYSRKKRGSLSQTVSLDQLIEWRHEDAMDRNQPSRDHLPIGAVCDDRPELAAIVATIVSKLPDKLQVLCDHLERSSQREVRRELGMSKYALQQEINRLREYFVAGGVCCDF